MAEEHKTRVVIEGDATSYAAATARGSKSSEEFRRIVESTGKALKEQEKASKAAGDAGDEHRKKQEKATGVALAFGKAVDTAKGGTFQIAKAATAAAASFGPWGIAIAVVGTQLVDFIEKTLNAADAVAKLKKQQDDGYKSRKAAFESEVMRDEERLKLEQDRRVYEQNKRRYEEQQAETRKKYLDEIEAKEAKHHSSGRKRAAEVIQTEEYLAELAASRRARTGAGVQRDDSRDFAAEAGRAGAMQRAGSDTRGANDAQYALDARLQALELERAQTGETISLIDQEEQARARLLQTQINAATIGAEKTELMHQKQALVHESNLRRLEIERAAEEKRFARKQQIMSLTEQLSGSVSRTTEMAAKLAGVSAKKQERIAAGTAGAQAIIVGALEQVKAVAAFASLNFVQGAAHQAAAIFAFGQGAMLLAQAGGAGGGGGGAGVVAGGGGPMGGGTQAPREATPGAGSNIPGSPGPQSPAAANGNSSGPSRTTVFQIGEVHTYGTPRREWLRELDESLADHRQGSRSRRTGTEG